MLVHNVQQLNCNRTLTHVDERTKASYSQTAAADEDFRIIAVDSRQIQSRPSASARPFPSVASSSAVHPGRTRLTRVQARLRQMASSQAGRGRDMMV